MELDDLYEEYGQDIAQYYSYLPSDMHEFRCTYHSVSGGITVEVKETDVIHLTVSALREMKVQISTDNLLCRNRKIVTVRRDYPEKNLEERRYAENAR